MVDIRGLAAAARLGAEGKATVPVPPGLGVVVALLGGEGLSCSLGATELALSGTRLNYVHIDFAAIRLPGNWVSGCKAGFLSHKFVQTLDLCMVSVEDGEEGGLRASCIYLSLHKIVGPTARSILRRSKSKSWWVLSTDYQGFYIGQDSTGSTGKHAFLPATLVILSSYT